MGGAVVKRVEGERWLDWALDVDAVPAPNVEETRGVSNEAAPMVSSLLEDVIALDDPHRPEFAPTAKELRDALRSVDAWIDTHGGHAGVGDVIAMRDELETFLALRDELSTRKKL